MPIIREWRCGDCQTVFESMDTEPVCPTCTAEEPERVFITPPAIRSPQTTSKDKIVKSLATDYGLADMSNKHGEAVKKSSDGPGAAAFAGPQMLSKLNIPANARDNVSALLPSFSSSRNPTWGMAALPKKRNQ
jgi:hypothetical protein